MWRTCHFDIPLQIHQALIVPVGSVMQRGAFSFGILSGVEEERML